MFKVGIIGPESTGKSTLSQYLAKRYNGWCVPEYARIYLEERARARGGAYTYTHDDVLNIAEYQVEQLRSLCAEDTLILPKECRRYTNEAKQQMHAGDVVFFDTELIITKVWLQYKYGECPDFLEKALQQYPMDVYLLCYPDLAWEYDPVRENPNIREYLFDWYEREVQALDIPYYIVRHT